MNFPKNAQQSTNDAQQSAYNAQQRYGSTVQPQLSTIGTNFMNNVQYSTNNAQQGTYIAQQRYGSTVAPQLHTNSTNFINNGQQSANNAQQGTNNTQQIGNYPQDIINSKYASLKRPRLEPTIITEKPNVKWSDVAGLESAKQALQEAVIWPVQFPQFFTGKRRPWRAILLYGPPGTGKSYLAKAVATETNSTFFSYGSYVNITRPSLKVRDPNTTEASLIASNPYPVNLHHTYTLLEVRNAQTQTIEGVSSSNLITCWFGESEKQISDLFQMARQRAPSIIFIDEIDFLCGRRGSHNEHEHSRRIKTEFLVQMQGVGHNDEKVQVLLLAATNTPYYLDQAVQRRFDKRIYIPLPDLKARQHIFKVHLGDTPHELTENDFEELAKRSDGFSGSDISVCVNDALYEPLRKTADASYFVQLPTGIWVPCSGTQDGALNLTLHNLQANGLGSQVCPPPISMLDFEKVLATQRPTVSKADLEEHIRFTEEFGEKDVRVRSSEDAPSPAVPEADSNGATPLIPKPLSTVPYAKQFPDISKIEVFSGNNFRRWQGQVFSILDMHEVAFALTDPKPSVLSPHWMQLWSHANKVCRHTIINTLSSELFDVYCSYGEAKEIWDSMITKYTVKDAIKQKLLIEKYYNWEMKDEDIKLQVNEYRKLIEDLKSENIILQEEFAACLLIEKLPQSWNAHKQQLKLKREGLSLSELIANIITEDSNRKEFRVR